MAVVRRELPADAAAVHEVHAEAFPDGVRAEAPLADSLRAGGWTVERLCLVAVEGGRVVGSVV